MKFNVIEIFDSIEGEGIRQGLPATFIRLGGCNLSCNWCDTKYACNPKNFIEMDLEKIVARVNPNYKRVTLTGGEPLMHDGVMELLKALFKAGHFVNIETNGSIDLSKIYYAENLDYMVTVDYKLSSSGQSNKMIWENFVKHTYCTDCIKFVIGSDEDLLEFSEVVKKIIEANEFHPEMIATTVASEYDPKKLADYILQNPILKNVCMQVQLHKVIGVK